MATHYTGLLVQHLIEAGYPRAALLNGTDLSEARLADPHARVSFEEHRQVVRNALQITGDPALGLWFGKQLKLASLGLIGYAAMSSPTLGEASVLISRFYALRAQHLQLRIEPANAVEGRREPTLRLDETQDYGDIRVFLIEAALQCVSDLSVILLGRAPETLAFEVGYPEPPHWKHVDFPHPVRFGMPAHRIHVGASALAAPLPHAEPGTAAAMEALLQAQLEARGSRGDLQERVRRALTRALRRPGTSFPSATEVGESLGYSTRTLRRELAARDTSFRALADEVRCRVAIEALREGELSVEAIATRLGYADSANFRRAFKRWTGRRPSDYRGV